MKYGYIPLVLLSAAVAGNVCAYEPGDWIARAGYASVDPRDDSSDLKVNGAALAGTGCGVDSGDALGITVTYMFAPHWGVELLAATPFKHDLTTKGLGGLGVADGTDLGSTEQLPPTLSVQYYFASAASVWQPYVGLGLNYTTFFSEDVSSAAKTKLGASDLQLDDSWGVAGEVGLDWAINEQWLLNVSVWYADIDTDASLNTALGKVKTTVNIDPWVYMIAAGYKF
jgi:outer membrane protein